MLFLQYFIIATPNLRELWAWASACYAVNVHVHVLYAFCMQMAEPPNAQMPITESVDTIRRDGPDMPYYM